MSGFIQHLYDEAKDAEQALAHIFSPIEPASAGESATIPQQETPKIMATTPTTSGVTLTVAFAGQSTPFALVIDPTEIKLPIAGSLTITAASPAGSLVENVTATLNVEGLSLPAIPLTSFPFDVSGALGILADVVKAADATITLEVVAS